MSKKTLDALDHAIRAHLANENPEQGAIIVTEWVLSATNIEANTEATGYWYLDSGLLTHHAEGLLRHSIRYITQPQEEDNHDD